MKEYEFYYDKKESKLKAETTAEYVGKMFRGKINGALFVVKGRTEEKYTNGTKKQNRELSALGLNPVYSRRVDGVICSRGLILFLNST